MMENQPALNGKVLRYLQLGENPRVREEALRMWREAQELLAVQKWNMVLTRDEFFDRFQPYAVRSTAVCALLTGTQQVVLMVVTLGANLECHVRRHLEERSAFRGYVLDRIGSYLVEREMKLLDEEIGEDCRKSGRSTTKRYSPGYRDFSIEAQKVFVDLSAGALPGLYLLPGFLLKPEKTITAFKGVRWA